MHLPAELNAGIHLAASPPNKIDILIQGCEAFNHCHS